MKVIILSAGIGSRLSPLTKTVPKSMLLIDDNTTVLERTIKMINNLLETEIVIVTGFCNKQIETLASKYDNCKTIYNPFYRVTNSIASLWFAREYMNEDVIIINGDVIVEIELFKYMLSIKNKSFVLYDSSIGSEADYKVLEKNGQIIVMSKELTEPSGEYVGITSLQQKDAVQLMKKIETMISNEQYCEWYETAIVDMIFTENFEIKAVDVSKYNWTEIDNINDLIKAKEIFKYDSHARGNI